MLVILERLLMKEKVIQTKILKWLNSLRNCKAVKYVPGENGTPDISGCLDGIAFRIEVKCEGEHPTKLQEARLKQWREVGCKVGVARCLEDAKIIIGVFD